MCSKKNTELRKSKKNIFSPFPIVGLGASAGGLEALEQFFKQVSKKSGTCFVVITHLEPNHSSMLPELLQRVSKLKVLQLLHETKIQPNCVFVIPPGKNITLKEGILCLSQRKSSSQGLHLPIDVFFKSLAKNYPSQFVGIILSGTGMDGMQGIQAIKKRGGITIAQQPHSAKYPGMPSSAIKTGLIDYILPPEKMWNQIRQSYFPTKAQKKLPHTLKNETQIDLHPIFHLLQTQVGHDFSLYKHNTICRRIEKRMSTHQINTLSAYQRYLEKNPEEIETLFKELLINVTNFFRDPESFQALKEFLLKLLKKKSSSSSLRIWVPACSTGEEVYSIAIIVQECMKKLNRQFDVQIFGTDIDESVIEIARSGIYSKEMVSGLNSERLKYFFTPEAKHYKISKDIRKMVVFAQQNITIDPPFTKLDLLSCRNLLIYFTSELQRKVIPIFHYSLNPGGLLFLGSAENMGSFTDLFTILSKKARIFECKKNEQNIHINHHAHVKPTKRHKQPPQTQLSTTIIPELIEKFLLENYAPTCIIIDDQNNIVYLHGKSGTYLQPSSGAANLNIIHMIRPDLKQKIITALKQLDSHKKEIFYKKLNLRDKSSGKTQCINLNIRYFKELVAKNNWKIIIIEDATSPAPINIHTTKNLATKKLLQRISSLEQDLTEAKENIQIANEELQMSNEEFKSSNEELQSTNEELQSTNEELETSKEELQSLNEELTTVNIELEARIHDLYKAHDDIQNLLYSTEIAVIFLDSAFRIRRFTPKANELYNLILTDLGRPISDIASNLKYPDLIKDSKQVLDTLIPKEIIVQSNNNETFKVRIMPYRTLNNLIDGIVITFSNFSKKSNNDVNT